MLFVDTQVFVKKYFFSSQLFYIMKYYYTIVKLTIVFCCLAASTYAWSTTFDRVYTIMQNHNCQSCHDSASPDGGLDLSGDINSVYSNLYDAIPENAASANKGERLVYPGDPYRSFLLRKVHNGLVHALDGGELDSDEGQAMPPYGGVPLDEIETEMIRQWILLGASGPGDNHPMANNTADLVEEYYLDGGLPQLPRPDAPDPDKGFQIHIGPIFIAGLDEKEFLYKYKPAISEDMEINRLDCIMDNQSHHFIMYEFNNAGQANSADAGLREVSLFGGNNPFALSTTLVSSWQDPDDIKLPGGTAYFWDENTVFDLNYHIPNYSGVLTLPSNVYLNVYFQPVGTAIKEMKADLWVYDDFFGFILPPGPSNFEDDFTASQDISLWYYTPHTHQYGTDYDLYLQDDFGNLGEQIFEGFWDYQGCNCNIGYYAWDHPPIRIYEPYLNIPAGTGITQTASYNNTSSGVVTFGLTTQDEMFLSLVQYTVGDPIPYVMLNADSYDFCANEQYVQLHVMPTTGGELTGTGVVDGYFNPSLAGEGAHTLAYTFEGITSWLDVNVLPAIEEPTALYNENLDQIGTSEGYDSYQWYMNGELIEGATESTYTPNEPAVYWVVASLNGCTATSNSVDLSVGIDDMPVNQQLFSASPNPYQGQTTISYHVNRTASVQLSVYDVTGKLVHTMVNATQQTGSYNYNFAAKNIGLQAGMYFVQLTINGQTYTHKLLEQ